jgi:hypothetical protein
MKMTMHIDEHLLARVIKDYHFESKTEAVESGLRELDRRMRLKEFRAHGLGFTPDEMAAGVDPDYHLEMKPSLAAAEDPTPCRPDERPGSAR